MAQPKPLERSSRLQTTLRSLPVHCLTAAELAAENSRGVYGGFHAPSNDHNRMLSSAGAIEDHFLRNFERPAQYSTSRPGLQPPRSAPRHRPASAPPGRGGDAAAAAAGEGVVDYGSLRGPAGVDDAVAIHAAAAAAGAATTRTGVPCFTTPVYVTADLVSGRPVSAATGGGKEQRLEPWRTARVRAYAVPIAKHGYGEGGRRAPHQDYKHYKYFGLAGRGAATSWGANPSKQPARRLE